MLIPLAILIFYPTREKSMRPVIACIIASFFLMLVANVTVYFPESFPAWMRNNNPEYNLLSFLRAMLIGWFIIRQPRLRVYRFTSILLATYVLLILVIYLFFEPLNKLSHMALSAESFLLLLLCITYFLGTILDEDAEISIWNPEFLICAAFSLFESINYFIFLFFYALANENPMFGFQTMLLQKYSTIIVGILCAIALYLSYRRSVHNRQTEIIPAHVN